MHRVLLSVKRYGELSGLECYAARSLNELKIDPLYDGNLLVFGLVIDDHLQVVVAGLEVGREPKDATRQKWCRLCFIRNVDRYSGRYLNRLPVTKDFRLRHQIG